MLGVDGSAVSELDVDMDSELVVHVSAPKP